MCVLNKHVFFFVLIVFSIFYSPKLVYSYFLENFSGNYDNVDSWTVENSSGLSFSSDSINFNSSTPRTFPFVSSKNSIVGSDDKLMRIKFKYNSSGSNFGNGFAVTDISPTIGTVMQYPSAFAKYTIFYVWHTPGNPYFHIVSFLCPISTPNCTDGTPTVIHQTSSQDLSSHLLEIRRDGNSYKLLLDRVEKFTSRPTSRVIQNIWFGHPETTGTSGSWASFSIDYVEIGDKPITFPYLSQKDPVWASQEYDSVSSWAGVDKSGIGRWGCAITSVAMILQNYKVNALDGSAVTPDKLNDWLKSQPDGYIGPGLMNWIAVTRYVKESYQAGHADKKLEYVRSYHANNLTLPAIIGIPGHFVVAHGEDPINWIINDPALPSAPPLSKTTSVRSFNRFTPSLTDLSQMMFVATPNTTAVLKNPPNENIPLTWIDEHLVDDVDGGQSPMLKTAVISKPTSDTYSMEVTNSGDSTSQFSTYLYDQNGEVKKNDWEIAPHALKVLEINFDSASASTSSTFETDVTPPGVPILVSPTADTATNSANITFDWQDSAEPSIYKINVIKNDLLHHEATVSGISSYDLSLADGEYIWRVNACDLAQNCSEWSPTQKVVVDTTAPIMSALELTTDNPTSSTTQTFTWLPAVELGSSITEYSTRTYDVQKTNYLTDWFWLGDILGTTTSLGEGKWWQEVKARDVAGNESKIVKSETITVDLTTPTLATQTAFDNKWFNSDQVSFFEYNDENLTSDYIHPSCQITAESVASYCWVKPYVCDKAGNCTGDQTFSSRIKLDKTNPQVTLETWGRELRGSASDSLSGVAGIMIQLTRPGKSEERIILHGSSHWSYVISDAQVGEYKVLITAYDKANNVSDSVEKVFVISASDPNSDNKSPESRTPHSSPIPSSNPEVLGVSSIAAPVAEKEFMSDSPVPSPSVSVEKVLGSTDQNDSSSQGRGWIIFLLTGIAGTAGLFIFGARKK
jgi:hypothetical protein